VDLVLLVEVASSKGIRAGVELGLLVEVASSGGIVAGAVLVVLVGLCRRGIFKGLDMNAEMA
jgi:hypothetical protein